MDSQSTKSNSSASSPDSREGRQLGHCTLLHKVGEGAASTVYAALDTRMERTVAVKILAHSHAQGTEQYEREITRFQREARAIARLSHPNIITIHDIDEQDGDRFLVMEFLDGMTLRQRLDRGPIPLVEATRIIDQMASAIDAIHREGIVHRDIKPSNVMLLAAPESDRDPLVKLMDFGVAQLVEEPSITHAGTLIGSPAYMSPEQALGKQVTASSDIWALGVLLYEMLSGKQPFTADHILNVLDHIRTQDPAPLVGAAAIANPVIEVALAKDPARRYESAGAMALALHHLPALSASPPRDGKAVRPTSRRTRRGVIWACAIVLTVIFLFAVHFYNLARNGRTTPAPSTKASSFGVDVPDVSSMSTTAARRILAEHHFKVGDVTFEYDDDEPKGSVISQDPDFIDSAPKDTKVDLVVSKGKDPSGAFDTVDTDSSTHKTGGK